MVGNFHFILLNQIEEDIDTAEVQPTSNRFDDYKIIKKG
jgi:hypothetical protein